MAAIPYLLPSLDGEARSLVIGLCFVLAVFVGAELAWRRARALGLDGRAFLDGLVWGGVGGLLGAHLLKVLLHADRAFADPALWFRIWDGSTALGFFLGGALAATLAYRRRGVTVLPALEALLYGVVPASVVGRVGCTLAFDHPGPETTFFLGMHDATGVVRHNVGFYELLVMAGLTAVLVATRRLRPFPGFHLGLAMLLYGPARILLDPLRLGEPRIAGGTAGQWFGVLLVAGGAWLWSNPRAAWRTRGSEKRYTARSSR